MADALMLDRPYTIDDVIDRGLRVGARDGGLVMVMDRDYRFATFKALDGVVREPITGPFSPTKPDDG